MEQGLKIKPFNNVLNVEVVGRSRELDKLFWELFLRLKFVISVTVKEIFLKKSVIVVEGTGWLETIKKWKLISQLEWKTVKP